MRNAQVMEMTTETDLDVGDLVAVRRWTPWWKRLVRFLLGKPQHTVYRVTGKYQDSVTLQET